MVLIVMCCCACVMMCLRIWYATLCVVKFVPVKWECAVAKVNDIYMRCQNRHHVAGNTTWSSEHNMILTLPKSKIHKTDKLREYVHLYDKLVLVL